MTTDDEPGRPTDGTDGTPVTPVPPPGLTGWERPTRPGPRPRGDTDPALGEASDVTPLSDAAESPAGAVPPPMPGTEPVTPAVDTPSQDGQPQGIPVMDPAEGYQGTVVAPTQIAGGVVVGVVLALVLVLVDSGLWPFAILAFVIVVAVSVYLATISVEVTTRHVVLGQGRRERTPRTIGLDEILEARASQLTWAQCFGIGLGDRRDDRVSRLTVRPGPTLVLLLRTGEVVRVSTPDPLRALGALQAATT